MEEVPDSPRVSVGQIMNNGECVYHQFSPDMCSDMNCKFKHVDRPFLTPPCIDYITGGVCRRQKNGKCNGIHKTRPCIDCDHWHLPSEPCFRSKVCNITKPHDHDMCWYLHKPPGLTLVSVPARDTATTSSAETAYVSATDQPSPAISATRSWADMVEEEDEEHGEDQHNTKSAHAEPMHDSVAQFFNTAAMHMSPRPHPMHMPPPPLAPPPPVPYCRHIVKINGVEDNYGCSQFGHTFDVCLAFEKRYVAVDPTVICNFCCTGGHAMEVCKLYHYINRMKQSR